jgi:hypothetical protein
LTGKSHRIKRGLNGLYCGSAQVDTLWVTCVGGFDDLRSVTAKIMGACTKRKCRKRRGVVIEGLKD